MSEGSLSGSPARGTFVTVEGLDFSGKSTLVANLRNLLEGSVYFTREPGGTPAAERIREVLLDPEVEMDDRTEAYLYAAARADHVRKQILPRLRRGQNVFCERFLDSSLAYQGVGRGLGVETVRKLNSFAVEGALPDRTFYLKLDAAERKRRAADSRTGLDRLERVGEGFAARVEEGFEALAREEPNRILVLDASLEPEELSRRVAEFFWSGRQ